MADVVRKKMMNNMIPLMLFGFMQMLVDAALWGIAAYLTFVLIEPEQKRFKAAAWISSGIYFVWDEVIGSGFLSGAGVRFTNRDVSQFVGDDFASIDLFDILLSVGLAYAGFYLGRYLVRRVLAVVQQACSCAETMPVLPVQPKDERINNMREPKESPPPATIPTEAVAPAQSAEPNVKKKGLAIASLVCGIIGGWASTASIPAVICGHMAFGKVKKDPGTYAGKGMAIAGLILGYLGLVLAVVTGIMRGMLRAQIHSMGY